MDKLEVLKKDGLHGDELLEQSSMVSVLFFSKNDWCITKSDNVMGALAFCKKPLL
jgi:hypothetical protein